jgi:hypothetical protein
MSSVFKYFLASFPLFLIFLQFPLSHSAPEDSSVRLPPEQPGACLRRIVHDTSTTVGYHGPLSLSSKKSVVGHFELNRSPGIRKQKETMKDPFLFGKSRVHGSGQFPTSRLTGNTPCNKR